MGIDKFLCERKKEKERRQERIWKNVKSEKMKTWM
jgi:hypothetical protein